MTTGTETFIERLRAWFDEREPREQRLLKAAGVTFLLMISVLLANTVFSGSQGRTDRIEAQRAALALLAERHQDYRRQTDERRRFDERLERNTLRLSTFLEGQATQLGIPRPTDFRDHQQPLASDPSILAVETTATFPPMTLQNLLDLAEAITTSDQLVHIHNLRVQPARRQGSGLEVEITLMTYRRTP